MAMSSHPPFAAQWLRQRRQAAIALAAVHDEELQNLDDERALAQSCALLEAVSVTAISETRRTTSGFVEQQRRFARLRG